MESLWFIVYDIHQAVMNSFILFFQFVIYSVYSAVLAVIQLQMKILLMGDVGYLPRKSPTLSALLSISTLLIYIGILVEAGKDIGQILLGKYTVILFYFTLFAAFAATQIGIGKRGKNYDYMISLCYVGYVLSPFIVPMLFLSN